MTQCCATCGRKLPESFELAFQDLKFVWATGMVEYGGKSCRLPAAQLALIEALIDGGVRGISRTALEDELWGHMHTPPDRKTLDVMMSQIRSKFRTAGVNVDIVTNGGRWERARITLVVGRPPLLRKFTYGGKVNLKTLQAAAE